MSDVHSAGGYIFAGTLFSLGLAGWQVFVSLIVGIVIIQGLANIIGVPSQKLAVPFPVISRMTYGVFGANIPALIRGGIAVVWYGIQTYLASAALMIVVLYEWPDLVSLTHDNILGLFRSAGTGLPQCGFSRRRSSSATWKPSAASWTGQARSSISPCSC